MGDAILDRRPGSGDAVLELSSLFSKTCSERFKEAMKVTFKFDSLLCADKCDTDFVTKFEELRKRNAAGATPWLLSLRCRRVSFVESYATDPKDETWRW